VIQFPVDYKDFDNLEVKDNILYFTAETLNGTTVMLFTGSEVFPCGIPQVYGVYSLTPLNGTVFFVGKSDIYGYELWKCTPELPSTTGSMPTTSITTGANPPVTTSPVSGEMTTGIASESSATSILVEIFTLLVTTFIV